jgi:hypothetical protein
MKSDSPVAFSRARPQAPGKSQGAWKEVAFCLKCAIIESDALSPAKQQRLKTIPPRIVFLFNYWNKEEQHAE